MKIYTKTGDRGTTSLFSGQRVPKNDPFIEALGSIDEANSALGLALSLLPREATLASIHEELRIIQHALFDIGASLATPRSCGQAAKLDKTRFGEQEVEGLERWIDAMERELPPLKTFILPGGHSSGAALHLARAVVRRSERLVIPLHARGEVVPSVLVYLNRLSDYLFVVSRCVNHRLAIPETAWQRAQSSS